MKIIALILFFIFLFQGQVYTWLKFFLQLNDHDGEVTNIEVNDEDLKTKIMQMYENIQKLRKTTLHKMQAWHYRTIGHYNVVNEQREGQNCILLHLQFWPKQARGHYIRYKNKIVQRLLLNFTAINENRFEIKITDIVTHRYEIPARYPFVGAIQQGPIIETAKRQKKLNKQKQFNIDEANYKFVYQKNPFTFQVIRKSTGEVIFNSAQDKFIYSDFYIQFSTVLPSSYIFGLGERNAKFRLRNGVHTIFNRDRPWLIDDGKLPGKNTYSSHPVYLVREQSKNYHMVYLHNSNAMDFEIRNLPFPVKKLNKNIIKEKTIWEEKGKDSLNVTDNLMQRKKLLFKLTGGVIDLHFFIGDEDPEQVIRMYHKFLGPSLLPPFWSLGYHQSRWGYTSVDSLEIMISSHLENGIPLDTIWSDIDYMKDYIMFTVNNTNFPQHRIQELAKNYYYIPIIDFGVAVESVKGIDIYAQGQLLDIFVKNTSQQYLWGWVWPGQVVYPDFFHPNISVFWSDQLSNLRQILPFSGIWLDMNEPSNFCKGQCPLGNLHKIKEKNIFLNAKQMMDYSLDLPYNVGGESIENMTISMNATHYGNLLEFDVHNFNGFLQSYETYKFLQNQSINEGSENTNLFAQHSFILTRSTAPGSGRFAFHWTGDNVAEYEWMQISISGIFNFNMFGIPMTGADICGFQGNTTEDLCARWIQLGGFYPFARNHNAEGFISQELYSLGPTVLATGKAALKLRYSLLKYYYTLFVNSRGYGTIFRPLFFEFYDDDDTLQDWVIDSEALIGQNILITPILNEDQVQRKIYLPQNSVWYEYISGDMYVGGQNYIITNKLNQSCTFFLRTGSILFIQNVDNVNSTRQLDNRFQLVIAMDEGVNISEAKGSILAINKYGDDLIFKEKIEKCQRYGCSYQFIVTKEHNNDQYINVNIKYKGKSKIMEPIIITSIFLYGKELIDIKLSSQFIVNQEEINFQVQIN